MRMHTHVMKNQLALDEAPFFFEMTIRSTPATFQVPDGRTAKVGLTRWGLSAGGGFGQPTTGVAAFAGVQGDYVLTTAFPEAFKKAEVVFGTAQVVLYGGVAVHGFQLSGGLYLDAGVQGVSEDGYLMAPDHQPERYRPGSPMGQGAEGAQSGRSAYFFSFTQAEGLTLGGALGQAKQDVEAAASEGKQVLAALRAELAPARLIDRFELREALGVPGVGLDRYAEGVDYYGDRYASLKDAANRAAAGLPTEGVIESIPANTQLPVFVEDIAALGFRLRVVTEVQPTVRFRSAEVGYQYLGEEVKIGLQAQTFRRAEALTGSGEVYAAVRPEAFKYASIFAIPWITISYSYNTPDATTFLPIPNAHVFGVQWVYGPPEMGRPLIPLIPRGEQ